MDKYENMKNNNEMMVYNGQGRGGYGIILQHSDCRDTKNIRLLRTWAWLNQGHATRIFLLKKSISSEISHFLLKKAIYLLIKSIRAVGQQQCTRNHENHTIFDREFAGLLEVLKITYFCFANIVLDNIKLSAARRAFVGFFFLLSF